MILTLEVTGDQATDLGAGSRKVFNAIGGTIGRLPDNDWVFPDPYISGRHALIRYLNGRFFVEDTSTNGVFINAPDSRVSRTQAHPLKHGDVLYIDAYEITVAIAEEIATEIGPEIIPKIAAEQPADDPFAVLKGGAGRANAAARAHFPESPPQNSARNPPESRPQSAPERLRPLARDATPPEEDRTASMVVPGQEPRRVDSRTGDHGTEWFGVNEILAPQSAPSVRARPEVVRPAAAARPAPRSLARGPSSALSRQPESPLPGRSGAGHFVARQAVARQAVAGQAEARQTGAAASREQPSDETAQLRELLAAAGIEGVDPSNDLARTCGEILRVVVGGLMEVLRGREQMKEELRMRSTTFKAAHNNPLKFSANVDDAFHNLLVKHNPGYLAPTDAFEDALHDVCDHQTAVLTAMRLAFETMLAQFDPGRLQEEFDRQLKKGSILGVPAKLRYWEMYREKYGGRTQDADASFRTLFGNEFAQAYEEQIERLKARSRGK